MGLAAPAVSFAAPAAPEPTPDEAKAFVQKLDADLRRLWVQSSTAEWIKANFITDDTERNAAVANQEVMAYTAKAIAEAARFRNVKVDPDTRRMLDLLRVSSSLPAPTEPASREQLAQTAARLEGLYGKGKDCGPTGKGPCRDLGQLEEVLGSSRQWDELVKAWTGWHNVGRTMRSDFETLVSLGNAGSREIGFRDLGDLWKSGYDMTPAAFEADTERLWGQVKPLYDQLHCYVRGRLAATYGKERIPDGEPIPAHVLGNMWAQSWENVYPLVEPYKGVSSLDITTPIQKQKWSAQKMARTAESFFTSLGLDPLPGTFWERSLFEKPRDREVVCHASAWDVGLNDDLRIKMCIKPNEEDLVTLHHELGHDYYFHAYYKLPVLFQAGANDGFHEAIGDTIALSMTPAYYKKLGLLPSARTDDRALINEQMKRALEKVAFLPFGKMIDQWRWDVFAGKTPPSQYNAAWWNLRRKYQGIAPPVARTEADFDPGAKYHVPANVPYTRYFLAHILQFQFHRALCKEAGHTGPLATCSIHGSKAAGKKFGAMLALGASKPWPDALEQVTGQREVDASALLDYFAPLHEWLKKENAGRSCGWK